MCSAAMDATRMTTLGIIGGIAPESTIEYYRTLVAEFRRRSGGAYPSIIINSIDLPRLLTLAGAGELAALTEYLKEELQRLAAAGADLALLASNTPHIVFDRLQPVSPLPLISIVEATCRAAQSAGLSRLALFGTRFTMLGGFYGETFARSGMSVIVPEPADVDLIHTKYVDELINGRFLDATREQLLSVVDRMAADHAIDGVILGGTELPLLLREPTRGRVRMLDTMRIHVEAAVERMIGGG
jgi:aspartate racemase